MIPLLVSITMSENDRKLLIILLVLAILVFILLGLLGMLIHYILKVQGKEMDNYMHDPVVYRVISDPKHFRRYGRKQNHRILFRQTAPVFILAVGSMLFYLIYALVTAGSPEQGWNQDFFGQFQDLLYVWDWGNPNCHATFWGISLLSRWPDLLSSPHFVIEHWASYVLVPWWVITVLYYAIVVQGYIARTLTLYRRARTVYEKSLEGYNYYDTMPKNDEGFPVDPGALAAARAASTPAPSSTSLANTPGSPTMPFKK